jgi:hypothetical protein
VAFISCNHPSVEVLFEMQKKEDKNLCLIVLNPEQLMKKGLQVI